ncbi:ATP-binding protein [Jannaschia formosa]|uniref:ATP-binding protein n=1 Tax=Jannaschia formosa TaxID=2259592 RepID=UPI000E1BBFE6|nr:ATP-binding protein [Jannaschia formosa]TFL16629.1 ATP-binding protein [Jannaschia formosa]
MATDPWHYPRTEFRDRVLRTLLRGGADAITIYGPRRTGKTQFLLRDVAPEAAKSGISVVYASFWQASEPPVTILAHALRTTLAEPGLWTRTRDAWRQMKPKLRVAPMGIGGEIDLSGGAEVGASSAQLDLDDLIGNLPATQEKPALLLLDEIQELASEGHRGFVAGLRTSLDKRRPLIKAIFTGSNMDGLRAMFAEREAPFLAYGIQETLPPLGIEFVEHMLGAQEAATGSRADTAEAMSFLEEVDRSPYAFRRALETMSLRPGTGLREAHRLLLDEYSERQGYNRVWAELTVLHRLILVRLAEGSDGLTGRAALEDMAAELREPVSKGRISSALATLSRRNLVHKVFGKWSIQDPEFARYLRHVERTEEGSAP